MRWKLSFHFSSSFSCFSSAAISHCPVDDGFSSSFISLRSALYSVDYGSALKSSGIPLHKSIVKYCENFQVELEERSESYPDGGIFLCRELWMKRNFSSIKLNFPRLFADSYVSLLCSLPRSNRPDDQIERKKFDFNWDFFTYSDENFCTFFSLIRFVSSLETTTQHSTAQFSTRPSSFGWMNRSGELCGSKLQVPQHTALELGTRSEENYWNETFSSSPLLSLCVWFWLIEKLLVDYYCKGVRGERFYPEQIPTLRVWWGREAM